MCREANDDNSDNLKYRFEYADGRMPVSMTTGGGIRYYLAYDQVGSLRLVIDSDGEVQKRINYDTFGYVINDTNPTLDVPFGFAGGLYDAKTRLCRFGYRDYDTETGRWTAKDPIFFAGGDTNLYGYCVNDPVNWVDPSGLDSLLFDGGRVTHYNDDGNPIGTYPATSGRDGVTDTSVPFYGPIPEGVYSLYPSEISKAGIAREIMQLLGIADWGEYRAPLHADPCATDTKGRDNFFLHGGEKPGSAGCIDIGSGDVKLFPILKKHRGPVKVKVKYK